MMSGINKQTVQYALFLIVCVWFLYQIHYSIHVRRDPDCGFIDNRLIDERIAKVLGRKGGLGKSHFTVDKEEVEELYGVDLIGAAVRINNNVTDVGDDLSDEPNIEGSGAVTWEDQGEETVRVDNASVKAVILKKGGNFSTQKLRERDSGPSRGTDVGVKSERKRCVSKADKNQTNGKEGCQQSNVSAQNGTEQMTGMATVESAKRSMRDLLLSEM